MREGGAAAEAAPEFVAPAARRSARRRIRMEAAAWAGTADICGGSEPAAERRAGAAAGGGSVVAHKKRRERMCENMLPFFR